MKQRNILGLLGLFTSALFAVPAMAQTDPTELGGGKKAYVLLIIDSSASMEQTTVADGKFPTTDYDFSGTADLHPSFTGGSASWQIGDHMDAANVQGFGSCFIYHPSGAGCDPYGRPGWRTTVGGWSVAAPPASWDAIGPSNATAVTSMRGLYQPTYDCGQGPGSCTGVNGSYGWRMQDPTQSRHVTVKEILTGNMILLPTDAASLSFEPDYYDARVFGPGCWFLPRQRFASAQPVDDQMYCLNSVPFDATPDFDQPFPHFQEVFDVQQATGVLDTLGTTALFAVAAFDGFREKLDPPWPAAGAFNDILDDQILGSSPSDVSSIRDPANGKFEDSDDCDGDGTPGDDCYNLGIWQVIGPTDFQIPATLLPELSAYTQIAINDTGFLRDSNASEFTLSVDETESKKNAFLGATFSASFKDFARDISLAKQPIARATPIAAAIHDVYQFMSWGQSVVAGGSNVTEDPINDDLFAECRPKHVVLLTDGQPAPERDPANPGGISDTLNESFGYTASRYTYDTAEAEINAFVNDIDDTVPPNNGTATLADLAKYNPRVHIFGLNLDTTDDLAVAKMARMAMEGRSCASALVPELIPSGQSYDTGNGVMDTGTCLAGCLVSQTAAVDAVTTGYSWTHPQSGDVYDCGDYPALILDDNDPARLSAALSSFMSALVDTSGLTSRTRLVVANRLDDVTVPGGGQYRVYSGVRVGGGSAWWRGVINRNTLRCDNAPVPEVSLDHEVGTQVEFNPIGGNPVNRVPSDNRRVWTSIPNSSIWDFTNRRPATIVAPNPTYPMQYDLQEVADNRDEFQETYVTPVTTGANRVLGTRVPFESTSIEDAFPTAPTTIPPYAEYNVVDQTELDAVVNVFRARIRERVSEARGGNIPSFPAPSGGLIENDRVIGGILNSNPLVVGPPDLDLPIASYREFRARYADRQTMLYVSSMDGLLHALHLGKLTGRITVRQKTEANTYPSADSITSCAVQPCDAEDQREAWAYMPWMVHRRLSSFKNSQAYLMDGAPVARDVRLCNEIGANNTNTQACGSVCNTAGCVIAGVDQWRTVLVQGAGGAGSGYYAMDITRPGGLQLDRVTSGLKVENPDPILLWEFDREWERAQLEYFNATPSERPRVISPTPPAPGYDTGCTGGMSDLERAPLMGLSVSEPEIATAIVNGQQRPIVVFGGGAKDPGNNGCGGSASGMAIYVVDLQTGSLIRRFTSFYDTAGTATTFMSATPSRFVGSPAVYDASSGAVATRGFIGDDAGRLFKLDFRNPDPASWRVDLFFDPATNTDLNVGSPTWGPGGFKPAVALNQQRQVVVIYGLGETGDVVSNGQTQAMIALTEDRITGAASLAWAEIFEDGEKVTGAPIVFNANVYFPTYKLDPAMLCEPGRARIWGVTLADLDPSGITANGVFGGNPDLASATGITVGPGDKWYSPIDPTLVRGLTVTLGKLCTVDDIGTDNPVFSTGDRPQPELIAQTSGPVVNSLQNPDASTTPLEVNALDRVGLRIEPPQSQTVPLSWAPLF